MLSLTAALSFGAPLVAAPLDSLPTTFFLFGNGTFQYLASCFNGDLLLLYLGLADSLFNYLLLVVNIF